MVLVLYRIVSVKVAAVQIAVQQTDPVVEREQVVAILHQIFVQHSGDRPIEWRQLIVQLVTREQRVVHRLQIVVSIQLIELTLNRFELFDFLRQTVQLVQIVQGGSIEPADRRSASATIIGQTQPTHQLPAQLSAELRSAAAATAQYLVEK